MRPLLKSLRMRAALCLDRVDHLFSRILLKLPLPSRAGLGLGAFFLRLGFVSSALILLRKALAPYRKELENPAPCLVPRGSDRQVLCSVIIPTYNRADSLARCLSSLELQTLRPENFEVIVVNNACTDHTDQVCQSYAPKFAYFSMVREPEPGLLAARHAGWRAAAADALVFCDDDIEASPEWLESIAAVFAGDPEVVLVGGNDVPAFEVPPPAWMDALWSESDGIRCNGYYSVLEGIDAPRQASASWLVFGCNYAIRRSALEKAGGFEPDLPANILFQGGGETGIACVITDQGGKVFWHPGASIRHHMPASRLSLDYMYKRGAFSAVVALYSYLRRGEGLPPLSGSGIWPSHANPALERFHSGFRMAQTAYAQAVFASPELRAWITKPTYLGSESPPEKALRNCRELAGRFGW